MSEGKAVGFWAGHCFASPSVCVVGTVIQTLEEAPAHPADPADLVGSFTLQRSVSPNNPSKRVTDHPRN